MNNLTRLLLTTASLTALVVSAQNTAQAASNNPTGGGTIYYGNGGSFSDGTTASGGFLLYPITNDTVTISAVTIDKTATQASAVNGGVNALEIDDLNGGTDSLTVNFNGTGSNLTESRDHAAALYMDNIGTGLTSLNTTGASSGNNFNGTQGIAVLGGGNITITTKSGDQIISNNNGSGFNSFDDTGGYGGGYSAGIYAGGGSGDIITITNAATITTDGSGHYFDAGISVANGDAVINNNANVTGLWAGVLGESTAGNVTVNNNVTISSQGYGVEQLGSGTLTVHNYGTGVIYATTNAGATGEGIAIISEGGPLNVTNDAGGVIVGQSFGVVGDYASNITNSGTIASGTYSGSTVTLGAGTAVSLFAGGTLVNDLDGVIEGGTEGVYGFGGVTINNAGNITAGTGAALALNGSPNNVTNDASGYITGGTGGYGIELSGAGTDTFNNYGSITGGSGAIHVQPGSNVNLNLYAGSTTGNVDLSSDNGGSVVALYTGMGTSNTGAIDSATGAVEQANGTLAAAVYGDITGNTGDILQLRGSGDGTGLNGVAGQIDLSSAPSGTGIISGFTEIDKLDSGKWQFNNAHGDAATNQSPTLVLNAGTIDAMAAGAFGGGTINVTGASTIEFSANGSYGNAINLDIASPTATNALTFSPDSGITANVTGVVSDGPITGQSIVINGAGTVVLGGTETYTGATTIAAGTLSLGESGSIASSARVNLTSASAVLDTSSVNTGGTPLIKNLTGVTGSTVKFGSKGLTVSETGATTFAGTITGTAVAPAGSFAVTGGGDLTLTNINNINAPVVVESDTTLTLGVDGALPSAANITVESNATLDAGTYTFNGTLDVSEGGTFTAANFNQTGGNVTLHGGEFGSTGNVTAYNLSSGNLTVDGGEGSNGNLTVTTFNQTGGAVTIGKGEFGGVMSATTYNLSNGNLTINGGEYPSAGTLMATTFNQTGGNILIEGGEFGGGAGNLTATTFNQSAGNITLYGGESLAVFNAATFHQTGGTLDLDGGIATFGNLTGSGGLIEICSCSFLYVGGSNANSTFGGDIEGEGTIEKDGNATLTLSGDNSGFDGELVIANGTLQAGSATALGDGIVDVQAHGTLDLNGNDVSIYQLRGRGVVTDSSTTASTITVLTGEINGAIQDGAGKLSLEVAGYFAFYGNGASTYTGTTTIDHNALLEIAEGASVAHSPVVDDGTVDLSFSLTPNVTLASLSGNGTVSMGGTTLILANANGTFSGVLQDGGPNGGTGANLEIAGGREALSGTNTFTGNTTIDSGAVLQLGNGGTTGSVAGAVIDNGTLAYDLSTNTTLSTVLAGTGGLEVDLSTVTITAAQSTLAGASLIVPNATLALSGAGTLDVPLTDNGTFDISAASSDRTIQSLAGNGTVVLGANTLTLSAPGGIFSGAIGGTGGLTLAAVAGGSQTLSGINIYTGATTIGANTTLALSGTGSIAASSGVADAGTFDISATSNGATVNALTGGGKVILGAETLTIANGSGTFSGVASGTGGITVSGGMTTLSGANTYTGTTTIGANATLALSGTGSVAASSGVADAGAFDISATTNGAAVNALTGAGNLVLGNQTLILANATGIFSGIASGTGGGLTIGGGRETLTGTNTFTGSTTINTGAVLQLGNGGTTGSVTGPLVDNSTLAFDFSGSMTVPSAISGTGGLEVDAGTVTVAAASTFSGASLIAPNATLALSGAGTLDVPLTDNGTFDISAASSGRTIQSLMGNGTVALGANTLTLSASNGAFSGAVTGTGGLTLTGGTQTLTGTNTYTGATTIGANTTLALSGTGSIAASSGVADAGTFDISATSNGATVNALTGGGKVILGAETLTIANGSGTFSGVASGTGGVTVSRGTTTLSGANTYTGATTIGANATLALSGSGSVSDNAITDNGTFDISGTANGAQIGSLNGTGGVFLGSETLTFVNASGVFSGNITDGGNDGSVAIASGTQTLTGDNTYGGGTLVEAGSTLIVNSPQALGTGTITFGPNSTIEFTANGTFTQNVVFEANAPVYNVGASTITWSGAMSGPGDLAVTGNGGTLVLTNTGNSYAGGTEVYGGSTLNIGADSELGGVAPLQLGDATTTGTLQLADSFNLNSGRAITLNAGGGVVDTQGFNTTVAQAITGAGGLTKEGSGSLTLAGANTYSGATTVTAGTVQIGAGGTSGSVAGNIADNAAVVFNRSDAMTYGGVVSGTGTLAQAGSGTLTLTGISTLTGATAVNAGTLLVNGSLSSSAMTVNNGATLGGTGTVGATTVAAGGTLSPGSGGVGTLSVNGALSLDGSSTTAVDITPTTSDKIAVSGSAAVGGTLAITSGAGTYTTGTDYTLVTASSVSGTFSTITGGVMGFNSTLEYSPTAVTLDLTAAGPITPPVVTYDFSAYGVTPNQIAAGTALEAASPSGALYMAVGPAVAGNPAAAPGKLNQLTGELHASARSALIEDGRAIRDSVLDHLAQDPDGMTAWGTVFGGNGRIDATGNTGALHHTNSGFIAGVDTPISGWSPDLRVGLAGAYNADHASIAGLGSNLHGSTGHLVAYAGWTGGPWAAKAGVDLGWGNMHLTRDVSFLAETEHSSQSTRTTQEFGDVGYNIALDDAALQPYFDLAHVDVRTGGFTEAGGLAALNGHGASNDVIYSTLGGRVSLNPWAMGSWGVTPRVDIGWQHAFSRVNPDDAVTFNDNGQSFAVAGAPLDKDAAAIQAGVDIAIAPQAVISLTYDGTFSSNVKDNSFRGGFIWKF